MDKFNKVRIVNNWLLVSLRMKGETYGEIGDICEDLIFVI
jgi:hypothetical protein